MDPQEFNNDDLMAITDNFNHEIGRWETGNVFQGVIITGKEAGTEVAVKVYNNINEGVTEMDMIKAIKPHKNILRLLGFGVATRGFCLIYELISSDLNEILKNENMSWKKIINILENVASGIVHLGDQKIIKGDIQPVNLLLNKKYEVKITNLQTTQQGGRFIGLDNRSYKAPEISGKGPAEIYLSDLYSFGVLLFQLITKMDTEELGKVPASKQVLINHQKAFFNMSAGGSNKDKTNNQVDKNDIHITGMVRSLFTQKKRIMHPDLVKVCGEDAAEKLIQIGIYCTEVEPCARKVKLGNEKSKGRKNIEVKLTPQEMVKKKVEAAKEFASYVLSTIQHLSKIPSST